MHVNLRQLTQLSVFIAVLQLLGCQFCIVWSDWRTQRDYSRVHSFVVSLGNMRSEMETLCTVKYSVWCVRWCYLRKKKGSCLFVFVFRALRPDQHLKHIKTEIHSNTAGHFRFITTQRTKQSKEYLRFLLLFTQIFKLSLNLQPKQDIWWRQLGL